MSLVTMWPMFAEMFPQHFIAFSVLSSLFTSNVLSFASAEILSSEITQYDENSTHSYGITNSQLTGEIIRFCHFFKMKNVSR